MPLQMGMVVETRQRIADLPHKLRIVAWSHNAPSTGFSHSRRMYSYALYPRGMPVQAHTWVLISSVVCDTRLCYTVGKRSPG